LPLCYHQPAITGFSSLEAVTKSARPPAGIVVMGSAASVNDPDPWIPRLIAWLRPYLDAGVPTLGLCYGHQLIAKMYGAPVDFMFENRTKLKGLRQVRIVEPGRLPQLSHGPLVVSHAEVVKDIPTGFRLLASSTEVAIDGLVHASQPIWSFQSHPEATLGFLENQGIDVESTVPHLGFGHQIVSSFLSFCSRQKHSS
jgi:GMP synthase (glutamine-hydrolysing)